MARQPRKRPPDLSVPVQHLDEEVPREFEGMRLDAYLRRRYPWRSRQAYQRMIRQGLVLLAVQELQKLRQFGHVGGIGVQDGIHAEGK